MCRPRFTYPKFSTLRPTVRGSPCCRIGNHRPDGIVLLGFGWHSYGNGSAFPRALATTLLARYTVFRHRADTLAGTTHRRVPDVATPSFLSDCRLSGSPDCPTFNLLFLAFGLDALTTFGSAVDAIFNLFSFLSTFNLSNIGGEFISNSIG